MALLTLWTALLSCAAMCLAQVTVPYRNGTAPLSTFKSVRPVIHLWIIRILKTHSALTSKPRSSTLPSSAKRTSRLAISSWHHIRLPSKVSTCTTTEGILFGRDSVPLDRDPVIIFMCPINGTDQLCYFTGYQNLGYARGRGVS